MQAMVTIAANCRGRGIPFVAILAQWHREPLNEALREDLSLVAASETFLFVDARPWFDGRDVRKLTNSVVDGHLNAKGFDIMAEETVRFLVGTNVLTPRHQKSDRRGGLGKRRVSRNATPLRVGVVGSRQFDQTPLNLSARSREGENA